MVTLSESSKAVLEKRYLIKNQNGQCIETPEDLLHRVANAVASIEKDHNKQMEYADIFYEIMEDMRFLPNSPTLMNAGTNNQMLSACFTLPIDDDLSSIFDAVKYAALIHKSGGGVGYSFSRLRPRNAIVASTSGVASGPVSFMEVFDSATNVIKQGGKRRGANMGMLRVDHPDIMEFISCKDNLSKLTNFNISVAITDAFMRALAKKKTYCLVDPSTKKPYKIDGKVQKMSAQLVWDTIIKQAWSTGEPGLFFIDRANARRNISNDENIIESTNPCLPDYAYLLTPYGVRHLKDINVGDMIWGGDQWTKVLRKNSSGIKNVYNYKTKASTFCGTSNHKIIAGGYNVPVKYAQLLDTAVGPYITNVTPKSLHPQHVMDGLIIGDGTYHKSSNKVLLIIGAMDGDYYSSEVGDLILTDRSSYVKASWEIKTDIKELPKVYNREVPQNYFYGDAESVCGFLRGLFSANGCATNDGIKLTSTSQKLIHQVQIMLSSIGIHSFIHTTKPSSANFPRGKTYICREKYNLVIKTDRTIYNRLIGFIQHYKQKELDDMCDRIKSKRARQINIIEDIKFDKRTEVYDITVDHPNHVFWCNGCIVSNCGEQPLSPYESCLTADTLIRTEYGISTIKEIVDNHNNVLRASGEYCYSPTDIISNSNGIDVLAEVANAKYMGIKPVFKVTVEGGLSLRGTDNHRIMTSSGWKEIKDIAVGTDCVKSQSNLPVNIKALGDNYIINEMLGWMHGDGWCTENTIGISFNYKDGDLPAKDRYLDIFKYVFDSDELKPLRDDDISYQLQSERISSKNVARSYGIVFGRACEKDLPKSFYDFDVNEQRAFLKGLFSADAHIGGKSKGQIWFTSTSSKLIDSVQKVLATMSIQSKSYKAEFHTSKRKPQYKLVISKESAIKYMNLIGFSVQRKIDAFNFNKADYKDTDLKVISIVPDGEEEVFDIHIPDTECFYANGILVHNCNLGSINLSKYVHDNIFDYTKLSSDVVTAVRFLNNVIDLNHYPLPEIAEKSLKTRKIGLGIMGLADTLIQLCIPYNSNKALAFARHVWRFIYNAGQEASRAMSKERNIVFESWPDSKFAKTNDRILNSTITTIAPTGTISIIAGCSSGIEPLFAFAYERNIMDGTRLVEIYKPLEDALKKKKHLNVENIMNEVKKTGSVQNIKGLPQEIKSVFVTAHDISPEWHIKMQAIFQKYSDSGVSKTINLPQIATLNDVNDAYLLAYKTGCVGITIYRDGCRPNQPISIESHNNDGKDRKDKMRKRPRCLSGQTFKVETHMGKLYVNINSFNGEPVEVICNIGKSGQDVNAMTEAIGRLLSTGLKYGVPPDALIKQLLAISGGGVSWNQGERIVSVPDAIGQVLSKVVTVQPTHSTTSGDTCPECGSNNLRRHDGCVSCINCQWSKCG